MYKGATLGGQFQHIRRKRMKKSLIVGVAAFVLAAVSMGVAQAQKASSARKGGIYVAADKATFKESPGTTGVSMAALWGDPGKGPHATFTKFTPGYDAGMHTHTSDLWIVVIKG